MTYPPCQHTAASRPQCRDAGGPGPGSGAARLSCSGLDAEDLALSGPEAEALIGDVERPVWADCHAGRERQTRDNRLGGTVLVDAHDRPGPRGRPACAGTHLQRVQLAAAEGQPEDLLHARRTDLERPVAGEPPHVF